MQVDHVKIAIFDQYLASSRVVNRVPPVLGNLVTLVSGSIKRRRLLIAEDGRRSVTHQWILFMTGSLDVTPKTT